MVWQALVSKSIYCDISRPDEIFNIESLSCGLVTAIPLFVGVLRIEQNVGNIALGINQHFGVSAVQLLTGYILPLIALGLGGGNK